MAALRQQILGIIKVCETAIASKRDDVYVDDNTYKVAIAILDKAKADNPDDEILAAATMEGVSTFIKILSVMQIVLHSLPAEPAKQGQTDIG